MRQCAAPRCAARRKRAAPPPALRPDSLTPRAPSAHLAGRRRGGSPLHHALHLDRAPLVQRLVRGGAVPRRSAALQRSAALLAPFAARHGFGDEALGFMRAAMLAAVKNADAAAVRGLLQHGLPPDGALLFALVRQRKPRELVAAMLDGGADPNTTDVLGTHVLTLAALQSDHWLALQACATVAVPSGTRVLQLAAPAAWGTGAHGVGSGLLYAHSGGAPLALRPLVAACGAAAGPCRARAEGTQFAPLVVQAEQLMRHGADPSLEDDDGRSIAQLAREEGADPAILALFDGGAVPRSGLASHASSRAASGTGSAEASPLPRRSGGGSAARGGAAGPSPLRRGGGSPACASPASSRHGSESRTKGRTPTRAAAAAERGGEAAESSLSSSWGAAPSVSALLERQLQSSVES